MSQTRLVIVADTHTFEADLGSLPDGDIFIHCGDMLRAGTLEELAPVADWISGLPHEHKVIVPGNHDMCFENQRAEAMSLFRGPIHVLVDDAVELAGVRIFGAPYVPDYPMWGFHLPREHAVEHYARFSPDVDILVSHGPPRLRGDHVPDLGHVGCDALADFAQRIRPLLHVFGHFHQDGGVTVGNDIMAINATTWECERAATVVDVDTAMRRVDLVQVPPRTGRANVSA